MPLFWTQSWSEPNRQIGPEPNIFSVSIPLKPLQRLRFQWNALKKGQMRQPQKTLTFDTFENRGLLKYRFVATLNLG